MAELKNILIPDLGTSDAVPVAEIYVNSGQSVKKEEALLALESDKAVMEIPSPFDGTIKEITVSPGDSLKTGDIIGTMEVESASDGEAAKAPEKTEAPAPAAPAPAEAAPKKAAPEPPAASKPEAKAPPVQAPPVQAAPAAAETAAGGNKKAHASPSVRYFARELGADLSQVSGTGPKGRIKREDVQEYIKSILQKPGKGSGLPPLPQSDPAQFGPVEVEELSRIQKISGPHLHASWVNIPHVTHFDQADITTLESWRKELNGKGTHDVKFSALAFVVKALYRAVEEFPRFNAVLDNSSGNLIIRKYYNIGIAVDTPQGLLVPVIKEVDKKNLTEIVRDISDLALKGREGKLGPRDLQGAGISISNLGGIGGTAFTPIINPPEVAILGLSRAGMQPVWQDGEFSPRLMLPLSLSYDHRVIDGALAARFTRYLAELLEDMKRILI